MQCTPWTHGHCPLDTRIHTSIKWTPLEASNRQRVQIKNTTTLGISAYHISCAVVHRADYNSGCRIMETQMPCWGRTLFPKDGNSQAMPNFILGSSPNHHLCLGPLIVHIDCHISWEDTWPIDRSWISGISAPESPLSANDALVWGREGGRDGEETEREKRKLEIRPKKTKGVVRRNRLDN